MRNLRLLDFLIALVRPTAIDADVRELLQLGMYQLLLLDVPAHAAIFETVELAPPRPRRLVNAVLRSAQRRRAELRKRMQDADLGIRTSHPDFLVARWQQNFGGDSAAALCEWNNEPPAIYARVNRLRNTVEEFAAECPDAQKLRNHPNMFRVGEMPYAALRDGRCYIQDPSTLLACELLAPKPAERVLDACAAPGGKTSYIGELMENRGTLVAVDRDERRVRVLDENLRRLGVTIASLVQHDWRASEVPNQITKAAPFDRILLDLPCSNTGVMRRRVDVRWRLRPNDFAKMQSTQEQIVRAVLPLLREGGALVYSTCSVESEENDDVIRHVTGEIPRLRLREVKRLLPFLDHFDGAFAAKFRLRADIQPSCTIGSQLES